MILGWPVKIKVLQKAKNCNNHKPRCETLTLELVNFVHYCGDTQWLIFATKLQTTEIFSGFLFVIYYK